MAEGGRYPWKRTPEGARAPYLKFPEDIHKPLPPPPKGFDWYRDERGNYELRATTQRDPVDEASSEDEEKEEQRPDFVQHVVLPSDTLAGLSLRYGVPRSEICRANGFEGEKVKTKEVLRIPLRKQKRGGATAQEDTKEVRLQKFKNATGLGSIEARIYLEATNYDVDKAVENARSDDLFELDASLNAKLAAPVETCKAHAAATKVVAAEEQNNCNASFLLVVHLDRASHLRDAGVLASMDVYVVAALWSGSERVAVGSSCAVGKTDAWRWLPTQPGSTIELRAHSTAFANEAALCLTLHLKTKNQLLNDGDVGVSKKLPLSRLVDGAVHAVGVDTGGELRVSITAPNTLPRDAVRAVAVRSVDDDNPFFENPPPPYSEVVTAVLLDDDLDHTDHDLIVADPTSPPPAFS
mmetsp:Transcript_1122/g.3822  ORF Transcript_1122/g.3822 Transcript_1122/m.3822 type:complete len:410 (-) Transcript_1122:206-1435(-)